MLSAVGGIVGIWVGYRFGVVPRLATTIMLPGGGH